MNPLSTRYSEQILAALGGTMGARPIARAGQEGMAASEREPTPGLGVQTDGEWIEIAVVVSQPTDRFDAAPPEDYESLLRWNAAARAGAKFVMRDGPEFSLCAEIPVRGSWLDPEWLDGLAQALGSGSKDFAIARSGFGGAGIQSALVPARDAVGVAIPDWAETGWLVREQGGGWVADLEVPGRQYQAQFTTWPDAGWRVRTDLARVTSAGVVSRCAVACLLLRAGDCVRLARPVLVQEEEEALVAWEVALPPRLEPVDVADALSSLSVGCRLVGDELKILLEESVAADYLAITGQANRTPVPSATPS